MYLNVVNPNTTAAMTKTIAAAAAKAARPDTVIRAVSSAFGPASIEGAYDDAFAVPGLLEQIKAGEADGADAHVIACSTTPGSTRRVHWPMRLSSESAKPDFILPPCWRIGSRS